MTYTGVSSESSNCMTSSPFIFPPSPSPFPPSPNPLPLQALFSSGLRLAQQLITRVLAGGDLAERLQCLARLAVDVLGNLNVHRDQEVADRGVRSPDSLAADPERAAVRRAGRDADAHRHAAVRRYLDLRAERGLGERDRHGDRQVRAGPAEHWVRGNVHTHVQVAGRPAALAGCAFALELDPLAVGHPRGNARLDRPR